MKQYEIEIKLPVKNSQEVLDILKDIGFMVKKEIQEEDIYFNSEYRNIKERDEALRIRKSRDCDTGEQKVQINFKGPKIDAVSMSRMELETKVQDGETMEKILTYLGFLPVASVCKVRKYLTQRNDCLCGSGRRSGRVPGTGGSCRNRRETRNLSGADERNSECTWLQHGGYSKNFLSGIAYEKEDAGCCSQVIFREVICHEYGKIPRHTGQNPITEGDMEWILTKLL